MCLSCKGVWGHATPDISVWHLQEACKELHGTGYCSQVEDGSAASFPATVAPWWVSCSGRRYEGRFSRFVEMGKPDNWISSLHYETCCPLNVCCQAFCNTFVFLGHSAKFGSYSLMNLESNTIMDIQLVQVCFSDINIFVLLFEYYMCVWFVLYLFCLMPTHYQSNEVGGSYHMEKEGLKRCLDHEF